MVDSWYVVHSKTGREEFLRDQLLMRRLEVYYPWIRVQPVNPRARKRVPYFPGYLFVNVDLRRFHLSALRWLPGAVGIVLVDRTPVSVPESLILAIRWKVDAINMAGGLPLLDTFKSGDAVVIRGGPFDGYGAMFDARRAGSDRVRVLLQFLRSQPIPVELPCRQIQYSTRH
jgi:transcription antitermination factor NusG